MKIRPLKRILALFLCIFVVVRIIYSLHEQLPVICPAGKCTRNKYPHGAVIGRTQLHGRHVFLLSDKAPIHYLIKAALKNEELIWYLAIYVVVCVAITISVYSASNYATLGDAIHNVTFMVASCITTTGYSCTDLGVWPWFAKHLVLLIMFFGSCAGSTGGGIKVSRIAIMLKSIKDSLHNIIHPRSVSKVRFNGKELSADVIRGVRFYICLFVTIFSISMIVVCIDPKGDFLTAFSAVDTTINNNGIGFAGANGPFSGFAWYSKIVFILDMLIGRLEIFPIMILLNALFNPAKSAEGDLGFRWNPMRA